MRLLDLQLHMSLTNLEKEGYWLQQIRAPSVVKQVDHLLRECCKRLNTTHKLDGNSSKASQIPTEKFSLLPRSSHENLNATVVLHGENIIQTDVNLKYAKSALGYYRATANPDVQWKLQQLQDASNLCVRAILVLKKGLRKYDEAIANKSPSERIQELVLCFMSAVKDNIKQARITLTMPKRKSLVELCQFPPIKSFSPPLPHDILLSYYIASAKIVCAVYQVAAKGNNGVQTVTVYQAECQLPKLYEVIQLLNSAFALVHGYIYNYSMLQSQSRNKM